MSNRFERQRKLSLFAFLTVSLLAIVLGAELLLRVLGLYEPEEMGFYTKKAPDAAGFFDTPYGQMRVNAHGFPDDEFDLNDPRPRVGYFGDSVTAGLGVGYGHRISDHLKAAFDRYQHFTIAKIGAGVQDVRVATDIVDRLGIDRYLYLMNLNDLVPRFTEVFGEKVKKQRGVNLPVIGPSRIFGSIDRLRFHSHLYVMLRLRGRALGMRLGFSRKGVPAAELHPSRHVETVDATLERVNALVALMAERGVAFCIVLLPYEMQISSAAEDYYASQGIEWEEAFIERRTQRMITERLDPRVEVIDAYHAFVRRGHEQADRDANDLEEYFVSRAGGALDWNHPNRAGHRRIADFLIDADFCDLALPDSGPRDLRRLQSPR